MAMRFEHEFRVPVPVEQAWATLLDVERVAPCLPGAALDTVEGDAFTGRMKVKVGPITVIYRGEASFEGVDKDAHSLSIKAAGKESRGTGTASALVTAVLTGEGAQTKVNVETTFNVTGRPAQFGRGVMAEVGSKLIDRFADNLAALLREAPEGAVAQAEGAALLSGEPAPTPFNEAGETAVDESGAGRHLTAVPSSAQTEEVATRDVHPAGTIRTSRTADEEALDLLAIAGMPLLKRLAPAVGGIAVVIFLIWLLRRVLTRE